MFGNRKKSVDGAAKLAGVPFFDGFSSDEMQRVAELADDVDAEKGAVLVDQGRVGQECYVILDGEASVYVSGEHVAHQAPVRWWGRWRSSNTSPATPPSWPTPR